MTKYETIKPHRMMKLYWRDVWYLSPVIRVRLELTANGLKGQCSLFSWSC